MKGKQMKNPSMRRILYSILLPLLLLMLIVSFGVIRSLQEVKSLVYRYIEDTAGLTASQISEDVAKINYEVISILQQNNKTWEELSDLRADNTSMYALTGEIQEQLLNLELRYSISECFYLYVDEEDALILSGGTVFSDSNTQGFNATLKEHLRNKSADTPTTSEWTLFQNGEDTYICSRYVSGTLCLGCVISLEELFSLLHVTNFGYESVPFLLDEEKGLIEASQEEGSVWLGNAGEICYARSSFFSEDLLLSFSISRITGDARSIYVLVRPGAGSLEGIILLQIALVALAFLVVLVCFAAVFITYRRILSPMEAFVRSLTNQEEENLSDDGSNGVLELETASRKFKDLLRKIQSLRIEVYEKELSVQKTQLEALQMQIRPHFYISCLNLIHSMAQKEGNEQIANVARLLSSYMRYVMNDAFALVTIREESTFVEEFVSLLKLRHGEESFVFDMDVDEKAYECRIPSLIIHTFVDNAISNALSLEKRVEISLFVALEHLEEGESVYICISDTGNGFSKEVLAKMEKKEEITEGGRRHIGMMNSVRRLELLYGDAAHICFSNMSAAGGAVVEIRLPASVSKTLELE